MIYKSVFNSFSNVNYLSYLIEHCFVIATTATAAATAAAAAAAADTTATTMSATTSKLTSARAFYYL